MTTETIAAIKAKKKTKHIDYDAFWNVGIESIRELENERGILASHQSEQYGCVFGRDSLITALLLLHVVRDTKDTYILGLVRKILRGLAGLQGREVNKESGEEPGKIIHEYRESNHERLTRDHVPPWYVYPDGIMRMYDTADATHLFLIACHEYVQVSGDTAFITEQMPAIRFAIHWVLSYGDNDGDGLFDYTLPPERVHGGLKVQSWMDSHESVFFEKSEAEPEYPIAPVEVQGYAYAALCRWGEYLKARDPILSGELGMRAARLKEEFNRLFIVPRGTGTRLAFALDGRHRRMRSSRSSMGHVLWAHWDDPLLETPESVLSSECVPGLVRRLMRKDIFVPTAGIRTLSTNSSDFDAMSYHNGSIWPHDTVMVALGFERFGYTHEANRVYRALMRSYTQFVSPVELFAFKRTHQPYVSKTGQHACQMQAWSAAALLVIVSKLR